MFILGFLFAVLAALVTLPALWDLLKSAFYVVRRLTGHFGPAIATAIEAQARAFVRTVIYWILGYIALLTVLIGISLAALKGGHTFIFGMTTFIFALVIWPIQKKFAMLAKLTQVYLPTPLQLSEPKIITLLMIIPIYSGVTAMLFPHLFYNGFGVALLVVLMAGTTWIVAFPTKVVFAAKAFAILTVITISSWVVLWLIPAHVEAATNYFKRFELSRGEDNLLAKLNERPVQKVTAPALGWKVETYENGDPVYDSNGFAKVTPCIIKDENGQDVRMTLAKNDVFKTLDVRVSVDAGEPLVQVYTPNSDGTWIVTLDSPKCWIPVSKTELAVVKPQPTPVSITPAPVKQQSPEAAKLKPETVATPSVPSQPSRSSFYVSANAVRHSKIFVHKGQTLRISASGQVNSLPEKHRSDGTYKWVGPDGWGSQSPGFITKAGNQLSGPLPNGAPYLALAARVSPSAPSLTDGRWIQIGSNNSFVADQDGYLYLIVNEKMQDQNGVLHLEWLDNNQGGFNVEVSVQ